jgi:hypothetical protein
VSIVRFPSTAVPGAPVEVVPSAKIIELLEKVLIDARAGMVVAVAIASVRPSGHVRTVFEFDGPWSHHLTAATAYVHRDIVMVACSGQEFIEKLDDPA